MNENDEFQELNESKMPIKRSKSLHNLEFHSTEILESSLKQNQVFLSSRQMINKIQLSKTARVMLVLRILLISLCCIYIPIETIFNNRLESIEKQLTVDYLTDLVPPSIRNARWYLLLTKSTIDLIAGKESIMIMITMIYIIFPFIALKLVFVINLIYYLIVILQCMYSSRRPFWNETSSDTIVNTLCLTSYACPSNYFFFISFVYLYFIVSLGLVHKEEKFSFTAKLIIFIVYLLINGAFGFIILVNKISFIYQFIFTWAISLTLICGLADLDDFFHNYIFKSLKNIHKARQYKMRILFYVFGLILFSLIVYFFVPEDSLNLIKDSLLKNPYCNKQAVEEIGMKKTFINITYIFGTIGAFWGASFAIEKDCGKWWEGSIKYLLLKMLMVLAFGIVNNYLITYTELVFYEFRFIVLCFTNFLQNYIAMGLFPLLFDYLNMNGKEKDKKESKHKQLIDDQGFVQGVINMTNSTLNSKEVESTDDKPLANSDTHSVSENAKSKTIPEEKKDEKLFKASPLIKGLEKHSNEERFEFTVKEEGKKDINELYLHFLSNKIDSDEEDKDNSPKSQN